MAAKLKIASTLTLATVLALALLALPMAGALASPSSSGIIVRHDTEYVMGIADFDSGLGAWFGVDIVAWCSGGVPNFSIVHLKVGAIPEADRRYVSIAYSDHMPVTVYRLSDLDDRGCPVGGAAPLASGFVMLRQTDNDVLAAEGDNPNANAWGFVSYGALTSPSGQTKQFSSVVRVVWDGADGSRISRQVLSLSLH